jgi:hypothetical protein
VQHGHTDCAKCTSADFDATWFPALANQIIDGILEVLDTLASPDRLANELVLALVHALLLLGVGQAERSGPTTGNGIVHFLALLTQMAW